MRKTTVFTAIILVSMTSFCFAVGAGIGARANAMGGCGIATANDITAAYFNPAGLMFGPENMDVQVFAGGATQGISDITEIMGDATNSDNLLNYLLPKDFNVGASINGGLGFSVRKVGLSAIVTGNTNFSKKADKLDMDISGQVNGSVPLTIGSSFTTPILPLASLAVGVNLKSIYDVGFSTVVSSKAAVATGTSSNYIGTGFGFDVGVAAKLTPLITVGGVIRNLSASEQRTIKTRTLTATLEPDGTVGVEDGDEVETKQTITPPPVVGVGVGVVVPITGTLIACDLENYSGQDPDEPHRDIDRTFTDTHIGIEQGFLFNTFMLRAGYYTYGPTKDSFYTYGLGINLGPVNIGVAADNSMEDSKNSMASAQIGASF